MENKPLSSIAHKLRTPLTVVVSTVNNFLDGAFGPVNEVQRKWLKKLESHTNNLEKLLNEVFVYLRDRSETTGNLITHLENALPAVPPKTPNRIRANEPERGSTPSGQLPLILAVDDEPDILDVIKEGLKTQNMTVVTATNGEEALRLAAELTPDVILMDVNLRNQNGLEIAQKIKATYSGFLPVILVTGQEDLREKLSSSKMDIDEILTKPFQIVELYSRVSTMLKLKKMRTQLEQTGRKWLNEGHRESL